MPLIWFDTTDTSSRQQLIQYKKPQGFKVSKSDLWIVCGWEQGVHIEKKFACHRAAMHYVFYCEIWIINARAFSG